jgi:hypothetical protein
MNTCKTPWASRTRRLGSSEKHSKRLNMETRKERLLRTFCIAKTEAEADSIMDAARSNESWNVWDHNGKWLYFEDGDEFNIEGELEDRTEIPVPRFIDLLRDRITPWRLEEDGLELVTPWVQTRQYCLDFVTVTFEAENVHVTIPDRLGAFGIRRCNVTTYTQLLTLIELIG